MRWKNSISKAFTVCCKLYSLILQFYQTVTQYSVLSRLIHQAHYHLFKVKQTNPPRIAKLQNVNINGMPVLIERDISLSNVMLVRALAHKQKTFGLTCIYKVICNGNIISSMRFVYFHAICCKKVLEVDMQQLCLCKISTQEEKKDRDMKSHMCVCIQNYMGMCVYLITSTCLYAQTLQIQWCQRVE